MCKVPWDDFVVIWHYTNKDWMSNFSMQKEYLFTKIINSHKKNVYQYLAVYACVFVGVGRHRSKSLWKTLPCPGFCKTKENQKPYQKCKEPLVERRVVTVATPTLLLSNLRHACFFSLSVLFGMLHLFLCCLFFYAHTFDSYATLGMAYILIFFYMGAEHASSSRYSSHSSKIDDTDCLTKCFEQKQLCW